jgi:site-specific DNA-methyltransferase (adenine-specific)
MLQNTDETPINYTACCTLADLTHQPTIEAEKIKNAKRGEINFYLCDNIEFMKTKPDKYYDLAIVDPPYGIGAAKEKPHNGWKDWGIKQWDNESPNAEYFEQLFRVSKNQIIWGANHFISKMPFDSSCWLIWDKGQRDFSLADGEMAWTSFKKAMRIYTISRAKALQEGKRHPTQKPIQLYRWILSKFAEKGMNILDTHGGSFTNAFACDMEGFALDICEIDEEYYNNGLKAYDEYKRQTKLF